MELLQFGAILSPRFATMEQSLANTGLVHLATYPMWEVSDGYDRQDFPKLSTGHTISSSNGTSTAPTTAQRIPYVTESGFHIKHGAVDIHFCHSSAIDGPRFALTPGADIFFVENQSPSDATALPVDPQHTHRFCFPSVNIRLFSGYRQNSTSVLFWCD